MQAMRWPRDFASQRAALTPQKQKDKVRVGSSSCSVTHLRREELQNRLLRTSGTAARTFRRALKRGHHQDGPSDAVNSFAYF